MFTCLALIVVAHAGDDSDFDHSHTQMTQFLGSAVSDSGVDYGALKGRRTGLDTYLASLEDLDLEGWSNAQKLALWVNAYNGHTLATMLDAGPPSSIQDLDGGKVWDTRTFRVAGQTVTLNDMEHNNARKLSDGRVHAAVNCASKGCPPLPAKAMTSGNTGAHLNSATRTWASTNAFTLTGNTIAVSKIFDWYGDDFIKENQGDLAKVDGKTENALWFLSRFVDDETKARLTSGELDVTWQDYDWTLNKR